MQILRHFPKESVFSVLIIPIWERKSDLCVRLLSSKPVNSSSESSLTHGFNALCKLVDPEAKNLIDVAYGLCIVDETREIYPDHLFIDGEFGG